MSKFRYKEGQKLIFKSEQSDMKNYDGEIVTVKHISDERPGFKYYIQLPDKDYTYAMESELHELPQGEIIMTGETVLVMPKGEKGKVRKTDYFHGQVEIEFESDGSMTVVPLEQIRKIEKTEGETVGNTYFEDKGLEIGKLVDKKQAAYGDSVGKTSQLMKIFLQEYKNDDNTYTIPEELLDHILLQVRMIDKQNRLFSNPKGDLMQENPYADTVGYGLLGMRMSERV